MHPMKMAQSIGLICVISVQEMLSNGVLKSHFRCLLRERIARYAPEFVGSVVNACCVLYNMHKENILATPLYNRDEDVSIVELHSSTSVVAENRAPRDLKSIFFKYWGAKY